jgi:hypothetical protein
MPETTAITERLVGEDIELSPAEIALLTFEKPRLTRAFADELANVARLQLWESSNYKLPRLQKIRIAENLYAGKIPKKSRIQFEIPLPVLSGMVDTFLANIDDPIRLKFKEGDPGDWQKVRKITALYEKESKGNKPGSRWAQKDRWQKKLAMFSGRGIMKYYAESDPEYTSNLEVVDYYDFHCEPKGGGHLENHMFSGQEGIWRTASQLRMGAANGLYDKKQVAQLLTKANSNVYKTYIGITSDFRFNRFKALGLDPENNSYVGEATYHFAEFVLTYKGDRWYVLFDPWTGLWIRVEKLVTIYSSGYYPWVSWATHEDPNVFWSKAFATDDLAPVADGIITMVNQEMTNRQKQNFHARGFDIDMFPDVARLDEAQHRPEALVPVDTKGGTRKISDGIYEFKVEGLDGTINLINFLSSFSGQQVGVNDNSQGQNDSSKEVGVLLGEERAVNKRFDYRSQSYSAAWGEVGLRYVDGLKEHMPAKLAIRMLGENGYEWDEIKRVELTLKREIDVEVSSSARDAAEDRNKVAARAKAQEIVTADPTLAPIVNKRWRVEQIYRDIGGYSDEDIAIALDPMNYGSKEVMSRAFEVVQELIEGKDPAIYYGADVAFVQHIMDFGMSHKDTLKGKTLNFLKYVQKCTPIVKENMDRKRMLMKMAQGGADPSAMGLPGGQDATSAAAGAAGGEQPGAPQGSSTTAAPTALSAPTGGAAPKATMT